MGAEAFETVATGDTALEAFNNAVEQAQYDYGHAGYTGTIAEKHSFVEVATEPMSAEDAGALAEQLIRDADARVDDKWGPAGCIPIQGGSWLFFGWASS